MYKNIYFKVFKAKGKCLAQDGNFKKKKKKRAEEVKRKLCN